MTGTALFDYDAELHRYHERLRAAVDIGVADRVLDIGCGTGQTTRDAARAAPSGSALGVDVSEPMLARARRLSQDEGLPNISFVLADAQVHGFLPEDFDVAISRFGTMFFADPVAAFTNIGRALRPRMDGILTAAGFTGVDVTGVHEPICYGPDAASALDAVLILKMTKDLLAGLDAARTERALDRLRSALAAHDTGRGVYFDSHAWIVTARRSRRPLQA